MSHPPPTPPHGPRDPLLGELIGERYRILRVLGEGGMGTVYLAEHVLMEKQVALKVLHPSLAVVTSVMDRFQKEAIALARIEHPSVVSATDFGKLANGSFYLALEFVNGRNLGEVLARTGALPVDTVARMAIQIARALDAAHSQGIVHRDLKPHNVMVVGGDVNQPGEVPTIKVLDFGLAKLRSKLGEGSQQQTTGRVFGTPHYMAPEQIQGGEVDGRTDLYSLGVMMYEMLAGRRPFDSDEVRDVLGMQLASAPPALPVAVPSQLRRLLAQLLEKSIDARPESAAAVVFELEQFLRPPEPPAPVPWYQRKRRVLGIELPTWTVFLPLLTFLVPFAMVLSRKESPPPPPTTTTIPTVASVPRPSVPVPPVDRVPALLAGAEFGSEDALAELMNIPEPERPTEVWRALAAGRLKQERTDDALKLFRLAVHHKPELKEDEEIARTLRLLCGDADASAQAVTIAAESLGARGVDLLFSVWAETKKRTPATATAGTYLQKADVRARGSRAVRLALELREQHECPQWRTLVEEARTYGDTRSLRPLWKLRKTTGCGKNKLADCYPCLRDNDSLKQAITSASERVAPRY